jgi:hypothetical protein
MQEKQEEYIWHCPGNECKGKGIILLKTKHPYLGEGTIRCPYCKKNFDLKEIMKANVRNMERYIDRLINIY